MFKSSRLWLIVACMILVSPTSTVADGSTRAAKKWGLIGSWKLDCSKPTSDKNAALRYSIRKGKLVHNRNFGDRQDTNPVRSAIINADGTIELTVYFPKVKMNRQFVLRNDGGKRIRAISNRIANSSDYSIVDGKFAYNGKETPWQYRCD